MWLNDTLNHRECQWSKQVISRLRINSQQPLHDDINRVMFLFSWLLLFINATAKFLPQASKARSLAAANLMSDSSWHCVNLCDSSCKVSGNYGKFGWAPLPSVSPLNVRCLALRKIPSLSAIKSSCWRRVRLSWACLPSVEQNCCRLSSIYRRATTLPVTPAWLQIQAARSNNDSINTSYTHFTVSSSVSSYFNINCIFFFRKKRLLFLVLFNGMHICTCFFQQYFYLVFLTI